MREQHRLRWLDMGGAREHRLAVSLPELDLHVVAAVLERVLQDPVLRGLDWMTSIASDRLLTMNVADPVVVVLADVAPAGAGRLR